jgi:hypothetical protein
MNDLVNLILSHHLCSCAMRRLCIHKTSWAWISFSGRTRGIECLRDLPPRSLTPGERNRPTGLPLYRFLGFFVSLFCIALDETHAHASITIVTDSGTVWSKGASGWNSTLNGQVVPYGQSGYANAFTDLQTALATQYPDWTATNGGSNLSGTLTVSQYDATATAQVGGATLVATYALGANDPPLASLEWIQLVYTSNPPQGANNPFIDPVPNDDPPGVGPYPFYNTPAEDQEDKAGGTYAFDDASSSTWPAPPQRLFPRTSSCFLRRGTSPQIL